MLRPRRARLVVVLVGVVLGLVLLAVAVPSVRTALAKDPGLGVRDLHQQGIDGRGVSVAILDGRLRRDHVEYAARLVHYEELDDFGDRPLEPHGTGMASLLVGATIGTAPGADLHYFALDFTRLTPVHLAAAIDHVVAYNRGLPEVDRVRLLSVSTGFRGAERAPVDAAARRALDEGLFVLMSVFPVAHLDPPLAIRTVGCAPWRDCDDPRHFAVSPGEKAYARAQGTTVAATSARRAEHDREAGLVTLYVPGNRRTLAGSRHARDFVYDVEGGDSEWPPYLCGVLAMALQAAPELAATELAALLAEGVSEVGHGTRLVDPERVVALALAHH
jgi:hypothetical protein